MRSQVHSLELVYPPISNQEAEWLKDDPLVEKEISKSHLYFIGQKPETFFHFDDNVQEVLKKEQKIYLTLKCGNTETTGYIDIIKICEPLKMDSESEIDIELGEKFIRLWLLTGDQEPDLINWFTTEKFIFDRSRNAPFIIGFNEYKSFYRYHLHYVGISKKEDSFRRLLVRPHDKRLRILSNEYPLSKGSRPTDEIVLFFFMIKSLEIKQYFYEEELDELGTNNLEKYEQIIADAEKAFVKILNCKYNEVKFENYPFSTDGLFHTNVDRYAFCIDEDISFVTTDNVIQGDRSTSTSFSKSDFIIVDKIKVDLIKTNKEANN